MAQDKSLKYHIEMYESTPFVELIFLPKLRITCPGCSLVVPIVEHAGLTLSSCSLTFPRRDTNSIYATLRLRAVSTAGRNARILPLKFGKIEADGSPWHGYELDEIRVYYWFYS